MNVLVVKNTAISIGSKVLVYLEKSENCWVGPRDVVDINDKYIFLNLGGSLHQVSMDKVKAYNSAPNSTSEDKDSGTITQKEPSLSLIIKKTIFSRTLQT